MGDEDDDVDPRAADHYGGELTYLKIHLYLVTERDYRAAEMLHNVVLSVCDSLSIVKLVDGYDPSEHTPDTPETTGKE